MATMSQNEQSAIENFKAKAREFWSMWNALGQKKAIVERQSPEIRAEYVNLMTRGQSVRSGIETITGLIDKAGRAYDSVKIWLSETFGLNGVELEQQTQLGLLPLIPIAAIGLSLAAMGKWISDAYQLNRRLDEIQRLENKGLSPQQAAQVVSKTMPKGFFSGSGAIMMPILLAAGAMFIYSRNR